MAIKRYTANADNTITNAFKENLQTRATDANMGESDIIETFTIYGQANTSSTEQARILMNFPVNEIKADRASGVIPSKDNVSFFLRVHNAPHGQTLPSDYALSILPVSRSWSEGYGLDMETYTDVGFSNWISASASSSVGDGAWVSEGGDYHQEPAYSQYISTGPQDIEVDITTLVEQWIADEKEPDGIGIAISSSYAALDRSFYVKKFFARGSEHFYLRPKIEARWGATMKDRRNSFYASSPLVPAEDNTNTLYIYNQVRGQLQNIPAIGEGELSMSLYYGAATAPAGTPYTITGSDSVIGTSVVAGWVSTGIYSASVTIDTSASYLYDVWHDGTTQFVTGSQISVRSFSTNTAVDTGEYVSNIVNLKEKYSTTEKPRLRMFVRDKNWSPTIYTVATTNIETKVIEDAYYRVFRVADDFDVISYGTGSGNQGYTQMSYDKDGNYFDIDMSLFETGYSYGVKVSYKVNTRYEEQPELFKFRVE
tara:strand:+ start:29630 stop:31078 length:1449 start_codon:yes stop_codon:yes gene_type:complete